VHAEAREQVLSALQCERQRLLAQLDALARNHSVIVDASELVAVDDEHDPEGATIAFERAQVAALVRDSLVLLAELDGAVARVEEGSYGICTRCGAAIGADRLVALPSTATCISCAT
jgi:RNA polymerase-binding transcription factor DksA